MAKPNDATNINRAICEALRYMRTERFPWNEGRLDVTTAADQWNYPLPRDFIAFIGTPFFARNGSPTSRRPLTVRPADWLEEYRYTGTDPMHVGDWQSGIESGPPHSIGIYDNELLVVPVPDADGDQLNIRYIRDLGIPTYAHTGSAWVFYEPDGITTLADTHTSAWFTEGRDALKLRAEYELQANMYRDIDGAQLALAQYNEVMQRYRGNAVKKLGTNMVIRGYL